MRNICNEEKSLKRYLKNHVSLNLETMVKFLITGMIGVSLTACGGGGGGGSSSDSKPEPPVASEEVIKHNETHEVTNSNSVITGKITGTDNNFTALKAVNSTVENKATISSTGDGSIGIHGTTDSALLSARANHVVTNSGVITMSGHEAIGMLVENGVTGINKGDIILDSFESDELITTEEIDDEIYVSQHTRKKINFLIGMAAQNQGTILNEKNIKLAGTGIGMLASNDSKAINNGTITLESKEQICDVTEYSLESDWEDSWQETHFNEVIGMAGTEKSEITNGENGVINLKGEGAGMAALENSLANNNGQILGVAKLEINLEEDEEIAALESSEIIGMLASEKSTAINNGVISLEGASVYGMAAEENSIIINNGIIDIKLIDGVAGKYELYEIDPEGMSLENSSGENNGLITINGNQLNSTYSYSMGVNISGGSFVNGKNGKIEMEILGEGVNATGIFADNYDYPNVPINIVNNGAIKIAAEDATGISGYDMTSVINNGTINIEGKYADGIRVSNYNSEYGSSIENNGAINVSGDNAAKYITGINANGVRSVINNNEIVVTKTEAGYENENEITGIWAQGKYSYNPTTGYNEYEKVVIENNGLINVVGSDSDMTFGIEAVRGEIKNSKNGVISVTADSRAAGIVAGDSNVINEGKIEVEGNNSKGISISGTDSIATNLGTINIDGVGSYGMYAQSGATVTNGATGVINVGASAAGGMYADWGSKAINYGTINIETGNEDADNMIKDNNGEMVSSAAMKTDGGTIENYGTINTNTDLTINSINGGAYVIGTSEDGSYGKISAKNVSIDGDVVVSAGITKNGFKNEYTMQNVVDAEDIKLGDNFNFTSNSLLYDASAVTDRWGNLDATLSRNDKTLSDFTTGYITSTANIFGKYQNEDSFKTLSSDAKEVIKAIDTSSVESINETLNGLTPTIYANLGRQILETSETFKEQDMVAINSLGENSYNFTFIGEYQDVDSRDNIEGYKSKMSGFVGVMNFGDGTFGTIGYGYNAVDYKDNGKGHIQTIHLGLNRLGKYEGVDYKFGIGGEYNFHENKRDIDLLGRRAESEFDSYGVRASGEVSKVFGEKAYVKPYLGLDLAHMKYDSFTESNANSLNANVESENYTSVLPKVGFVVGDRFHGLDLFAGVEYSYELGNMDKEQNFSYEGFEGKGKLPKDSLECGTTGVKAGASYEVNNFTLGASVGKNFGRRDNSFVNMSLGYRF
ncbi:autotransporter outer membrane beta-barrel domain-containing protein [Cetobacterium somerae]|uniref:autotransporter outer membrane beta-barrel domain-containing protein n=1 Tax=Cetobacterium somerae TaxID=188913 RepID=UPI003D76884D